MTSWERFLVLAVFLLIILATFLAAILVGLGLFEEADPELFKWLITVGIVEILAAVVWAFRQSIRPHGRVAINMIFRRTQQDIDLGDAVELDENQCKYEVWDHDGAILKKSDTLNVTQGPAGVWQGSLPTGVAPTDHIILRLVDKNGGKWIVRKFPTLVQTREARPDA